MGRMSTHLFIDDLREPPEGAWAVVRTSEEAIAFLEAHGCPAVISFDHDLGGDDTAMRVVRWMIDRDLDAAGFIPEAFEFRVHSANPIGAANIESALGRYLGVRGRADD